MIIISIIISLIFILLIVWLCKSYYNDIVELENRMLQLEKRIENLKKVVMYKPISFGLDTETNKKKRSVKNG